MVSISSSLCEEPHLVYFFRSIYDEDAPDVADVFYSHLFKDGQTSESHIDITEAALALHLAVKKLREEKKVTFQRWVPFIHLGL